MTFIKNIREDLIYYTISSFQETGLVKHGFSTRLGGVSKGSLYSLNLGVKKKDTQENLYKNYGIMAKALDIPIKNMVLSDQVHGDRILQVGTRDCGKGLLRESDIREVDALITNEKEVALVTFYADCVPLFFLDPVQKSIGLAHAGWRGSVKKIGQKTLKKMTVTFGTQPKDCLVAIGPSIGSCCFEVGGEVIKAIEEHFPNPEKYYVSVGNNKYIADLKTLNKNQFIEMGVPPENITTSHICTKCNREIFFSHRGDKGNTGSLAAFLQLI